jgi:hypothetical protein
MTENKEGRGLFGIDIDSKKARAEIKKLQECYRDWTVEALEMKYATREFVNYLRKVTRNFDDDVVESLLLELKGGELRSLVITAPYVMERRPSVIGMIEINYYKCRPNFFEGRGGVEA